MPASAQHDKVMIVKVPYGSHFVTGTPALNGEKLYDHIFYQLVVDYDEHSWLGSSSTSGGHAPTSPYVHPRLKSLSHDEGVRNHRVLTESPVVYIVVFENNDAMRRAGWLKDALGDKRPDKSGRYKSRYVVYVGETNNILKRTHQHLMASGHLTLEGEEDSLESVQREIDQRTRADRIIQQAVADGCDVQQYVIWDTFFTKSMTLDIENKFIDYLWSLDDVFTLNSRGNAQRSYYMSETKDLVCSKVWRRLSLDNPFLFPSEHDIWNSELYKVSPFHSLGKEQSAAVNDICESVLSLINGLPVHGETLVPTTSEHRLILIEGASGTGKSIVLSTLFVRLAEALRMPNQGDDGYGVHGSGRVSLVINQDQQLTLYRNLAKKIGLMSTEKDACVFKATQFINMVESGKREQPDVVLVDEAHLLRTTPHRSYPKKYHGNQLYDILLRAKVVVAVIDPVQVMRSSQHWDPEVLHALLPERTDPTDGSLEYAGPVTLRSNGNGSPGEDSFHSYRIMLTEQFRIDASDEVMRWIDRLADVHAVGMEPIPQDSLPRDMVHGVHGTKPYDIRVFTSPQLLAKEIDKRRREMEGELAARPDGRFGASLCRLLATYDWGYDTTAQVGYVSLYRTVGESREASWQMPLDDGSAPAGFTGLPEDKFSKKWNYSDSSNDGKHVWAGDAAAEDEVGSYFSVQGFDLNYAGVIIGPSVRYRDGRIMVDAGASRDGEVSGPYAKELVIQQLKVLLRRGIHGLYLFAVDSGLQAALVEAAWGAGRLDLVG